MSIVLNIGARFLTAFGKSIIANKVVISKDEEKYNLEVYDNTDREIDKTIFAFDNKELVFNGMLQGDLSSVFAPPLLLSFSREKNLIETIVKGSDNVVIERWGTSPWNIDIKGLLIDVENRFYPNSKIEELTELFEHNNIIEVVGEQFYDKNIDSIYLNSISINPVEGYTDTIQFNISARSQKAVNYTLLNPIQ